MGPKVQMARSRVPVAKVQLKSTAHKAVLHLETPVECPLCIETLDDTDRDFFPCPCGYQVCLFCYQRLQNEYNNTCPGCRQQYGNDLDAVRQHIERKHKQQQHEVTVAARTAASSHAAHAHAGHGHAHGHHSHAHVQHHSSQPVHGGHAGAHRGLVAASGSSAAAAAPKQRHAQQLEPAAPAAPAATASHARAGPCEAASSSLPGQH
ncbi:RING/Ubox like zinc-binding domain-containing protein [Scenedesmus sp. NREL 46B-D3]|nr:RING/Ubox like zinc-binding domain-containing protein [Scenedesmus sp. NREL 46B-D3]